MNIAIAMFAFIGILCTICAIILMVTFLIVDYDNRKLINKRHERYENKFDIDLEKKSSVLGTQIRSENNSYKIGD